MAGTDNEGLRMSTHAKLENVRITKVGGQQIVVCEMIFKFDSYGHSEDITISHWHKFQDMKWTRYAREKNLLNRLQINALL